MSLFARPAPQGNVIIRTPIQSLLIRRTTMSLFALPAILHAGRCHYFQDQNTKKLKKIVLHGQGICHCLHASSLSIQGDVIICSPGPSLSSQGDVIICTPPSFSQQGDVIICKPRLFPSRAMSLFASPVSLDAERCHYLHATSHFMQDGVIICTPCLISCRTVSLFARLAPSLSSQGDVIICTPRLFPSRAMSLFASPVFFPAGRCHYLQAPSL